jgi:hypothetical protein
MTGIDAALQARIVARCCETLTTHGAARVEYLVLALHTL